MVKLAERKVKRTIIDMFHMFKTVVKIMNMLKKINRRYLKIPKF